MVQVKELVGFDGSIEWDHTQPDGQPRRRLDITRAQNEFGWSAGTPIREGLRNTIAWFVEKHQTKGRIKQRAAADYRDVRFDNLCGQLFAAGAKRIGGDVRRPPSTRSGNGA